MATSFNDLINDNVAKQLVNERLDTSVGDNFEGYGQMSDELLKIILDLYTEEDDLYSEKMKSFSVLEIIAYLQMTHKYYLKKKLPEIEQSLFHVFSKYRQSHQLLAALVLFFNTYKDKLIKHIRMEEKDFFPFIKEMVALKENPINVSEFLENNSIKNFEDDHDAVEDELSEVKTIIEQHSEDNEIPLPFKIFLNQVGLFELELRKHAYIEDHVLLPMVIELENDLQSIAKA